MLARFTDLLEEARSTRRAVGGFTAYDLTTGAAILRSAAEREVGVIVIVSAQTFAATTGPSLIAGLMRMAADAPVPACLQLDHVSDLGAIEQALAAGVGSVMADGSRLPYEENLTLVREAVQLADAAGGCVEAELGRIEGDEENARDVAATSGLTDPQEAAAFIAATGAHCLAVSIGNVHGVYRHPPRLDYDRLRSIADTLSSPLSLHGASGIADDDVRRTIAHGIVKVNVNTELRQRWFDVVSSEAPNFATGARLLAMQTTLEDAIAQVVDGKLRTFSAR